MVVCCLYVRMYKNLDCHGGAISNRMYSLSCCCGVINGNKRNVQSVLSHPVHFRTILLRTGKNRDENITALAEANKWWRKKAASYTLV